MRPSDYASFVVHRPSMTAGGNLALRAASAVVLAAIAGLGAWFGGVVAGVVLAAAAVIVHLEWSAITEGGMDRALPFTATVALAVLALGLGADAAAAILGGGAVVAGAASSLTPWRPAGVLYALALGVAILLIRRSTLGLEAVVFVLFVTAATDTGAYFAGRTIGGPKLWPRVSPKKTWSGAIGGFLAAIAVGAAVAAAFALPVTAGLIAVAGVLSVVGQLGDLFESSIKRRFGVKDSGHLIPGHGGLMDRVDALTIASLVALAIGLLHAGPADIGRGLLAW